MAEIVNASGVKLTAENVAYLARMVGNVPDWGIDDTWRDSAQIMRAVWGALPVTTGTDAP